MKKTFLKPILFLLCTVALTTGCKKNEATIDPLTTGDAQSSSSFETTSENWMNGWISGFAHYPVGGESFYQLESRIAPLPPPLPFTNQGIMIKGNNHSDALFMFLKKKLSGLQPNKRYSFLFDISIASNAPSGAGGIGGPPGEAVRLGVGATRIEPLTIIDTTGMLDYYRMNIDEIQGNNNGTDMVVIGNIANGTNQAIYRLIKRRGSFIATTNSNGTIWVIVGTSSGFEGITKMYYDSIAVHPVLLN